MYTITERIAHYATRAGSQARTSRGRLRAAVRYLRDGARRRGEIYYGRAAARRAEVRRALAATTPDPRWSPGDYHICYEWDVPLVQYPAIPAAVRDAARVASDRAMRRSIRRRLTRQTRITADTLAEWDATVARREATVRDLARRLAAADAYAEARPRGMTEAIRAVESVTYTVPEWRGPRTPHIVYGLRGRLTGLPGHSQRERRELSPRSGVSWDVEPGTTTEPRADQDYEVTFAGSGQTCHRPDLFRRRDLEVHHAVHVMAVRSVAYLRADGGMDWQIGLRSGMIAPRAGWEWVADEHGVCLRSTADHGVEYHPSADDLLAGRPVDYYADVARDAADERAQADALIQRAAEEVSSVWVCWSDARRSGACAQGIRSWCRQHRVDPTRHVPAPLLLRRGGRDTSWLRRIVQTAAERDRAERERGYALLEEHATPVTA